MCRGLWRGIDRSTARQYRSQWPEPFERRGCPDGKSVAAAVDVPVIVWGSGNTDKDAEVLRKIAEACDGMNLIIGPVVEGNYKQIGAGSNRIQAYGGSLVTDRYQSGQTTQHPPRKPRGSGRPDPGRSDDGCPGIWTRIYLLRHGTGPDGCSDPAG